MASDWTFYHSLDELHDLSTIVPSQPSLIYKRYKTKINGDVILYIQVSLNLPLLIKTKCILNKKYLQKFDNINIFRIVSPKPVYSAEK